MEFLNPFFGRPPISVAGPSLGTLDNIEDFVKSAFIGPGLENFLDSSSDTQENGESVVGPLPNSWNNAYASESNSAQSLISDEDYLESQTGIDLNDFLTAMDSNALNHMSAEQVMKYNSEEAEKSRQFQLMMRDTQIQSTMKQLREEGINPLLALSGSLSYAQGSSGSSASASAQRYDNDDALISAFLRSVASIIGNIARAIPGFMKILG